MRRSLLLVPLLLLAACGSAGDQAAAPAATTSPSGEASAPASASPVAEPDIEGLEVLREEQSRGHVTGPVEYDRMPPLGGDHNPRWLACDVYDESVPVEFAVHSLEHGAVWLAYDPDLPDSEVELLEQLAAGEPEYVLVSPEPGLDSRIVAAAWGRTLESASADDARLAQFVEVYAGGAQGGEPGAPCRGGGVTPREARGQLGTSA